MSNYKIITGLTESEFFSQELNNTLQQGMYIFKDTKNTAIVNGSRENAQVSLKTSDIKEGNYSNLGSGLILTNEGEGKGYSLYYRRGSEVYSISGGSGSGTGGSDGNIFYTKLNTTLLQGETTIEPSTAIGSIITITAFNEEGHELFIELRKRNRGFVVYSEIEIPNAQLHLMESKT
jgi:hypothetical protein